MSVMYGFMAQDQEQQVQSAGEKVQHLWLHKDTQPEFALCEGPESSPSEHSSMENGGFFLGRAAINSHSDLLQGGSHELTPRTTVPR